MSVTITMTGDPQDLLKAMAKARDGARELNDQYKEMAAETRRGAQMAKRAFEEQLQPLERYRRNIEQMKRAYKENRISLDEYKAGLVSARNEKQRMTVQTGQLQGTMQKLGTVGKTALIGILGPLTSISGAVGVIVKGHENWLQSQKEISKQTQQTMKEMVAFAALQEEGTTRERALRVLEVSRGKAPFAEAFDLAQAMQSSLGSFERGLEATRNIFEATEVGIPAELGKEIGIQATGQGMVPEVLLRGVFAAGEASGRSAKEIAPAAPALQSFADKAFGLGVAAALSPTKGAETEVYTRQAGIALSAVSPGAQWFRGQGLAEDASQQERLKKLRDANIDSLEKLTQVGFTEIRQREALLTLVRQYGEVLRLQDAAAKGMADENLIREKRSKIEREIPEMALTRVIEEEKSAFKEARSFDAEAMKTEVRQRMIVSELARRGLTQGPFGMNLYDEEGNVNWARLGLTRIMTARGGPSPSFGAGNVPTRTQMFQEAFGAADLRTRDAMEKIEQNTRKVTRPRVPEPAQ